MNRLLFVALACAVSGTAFAQTFHAKEFGSLACTDKRIVLELSDAVAHPGTMTDAKFAKLAELGQCSPMSPDVKLRVIRAERISLPAGQFLVLLMAFDNPPDAATAALRFYVRAADVERY